MRLDVVIEGRYVAMRSVHLLRRPTATSGPERGGTSFTYTSGKRRPASRSSRSASSGTGGQDRSVHDRDPRRAGADRRSASRSTGHRDAEDRRLADQSALDYDLEMQTIDEDADTELATASPHRSESGTLDYDGWAGDDEPPIEVDEDPGDGRPQCRAPAVPGTL